MIHERKKLYLVRHCHSWQNEIVDRSKLGDDSWLSSNNWFRDLSNSLVPLTQKGLDQAKQLGSFIQNKIDLSRPSFFIHSGFLRAQQTAVEMNISDDWQVSHLTRELNFGDVNHTREESFQRFYKRHIKDPNFKFPHGESFYDVLDRAGLFLRSLSDIDTEQIIVVSHSVFMQIFLFNLFGYPANIISEIPNIPELSIPKHGSIYEIEFDSYKSNSIATQVSMVNVFDDNLSWKSPILVNRSSKSFYGLEKLEREVYEIFK